MEQLNSFEGVKNVTEGKLQLFSSHPNGMIEAMLIFHEDIEKGTLAIYFDSIKGGRGQVDNLLTVMQFAAQLIKTKKYHKKPVFVSVNKDTDFGIKALDDIVEVHDIHGNDTIVTYGLMVIEISKFAIKFFSKGDISKQSLSTLRKKLRNIESTIKVSDHSDVTDIKLDIYKATSDEVVHREHEVIAKRKAKSKAARKKAKVKLKNFVKNSNRNVK